MPPAAREAWRALRCGAWTKAKQAVEKMTGYHWEGGP